MIEFLDTAEGRKLLLRAKTDDKAKEKILKICSGYIAAMAKQVVGNWNRHQMEDYIQEGKLTVLKCIEAYDPEKGDFKNFLLKSIKNHFSYMSAKARNFGASWQTIKKAREGARYTSYHKQWKLNNLAEIEIVSLESPSVDLDISIDRILDDMFIQEIFSETISCLTDRERLVLDYKYGLEGKEAKSESVAAFEMGLSKEHYNIILNAARKKLKQAIENKIKEFKGT